jgi:transposase
VPPYTDAFGTQGPAWLATLPLRPVYQHALRGFLEVLDVLRTPIRDASRLIDHEAKATPAVRILCTLPGVGHDTALLILAESAMSGGFPPPSSWCRTPASPPSSGPRGGHVHTGPLSKQGSAWLRWIRVEAAQYTRRRPGRYRALFERVARRKGSKVARVAVARALLTKASWMLRHATQPNRPGTPLVLSGPRRTLLLIGSPDPTTQCARQARIDD